MAEVTTYRANQVVIMTNRRIADFNAAAAIGKVVEETPEVRHWNGEAIRIVCCALEVNLDTKRQNQTLNPWRKMPLNYMFNLDNGEASHEVSRLNEFIDWKNAQFQEYNDSLDELVKSLAAPSDSVDNCPICYESLAGAGIHAHEGAAAHVFHVACLKIWLTDNDSCPICRYKII